MRTRRGILIVLLTVSLLGAATAAGVLLLWPGLPHPSVADRDQLLRWLVLRDLSQESDETQLVLVRRLDEEFRDGIDWEATGGGLTEPQRKQLWDNVVVLLKPWFLDKTQQYHALSADKRRQFLDEIIDTLKTWGGVEALRTDTAGDSPTPSSANGLQAELLDGINRWSDEADPQKRDQIRQFWAAFSRRWLQRLVPSIDLPSIDRLFR